MMEHLTFETVVDFLAINDLSEESLELSKKVNGHIRSCEQCRKLVQSMSVISQEFEDLMIQKSLNKKKDLNGGLSK